MKSARSTSEREWDRKIGSSIAFLRKRDANQTQAQFAKRIGVSRGHLANIESGRTPLTFSVGWKSCREVGIHPAYVCIAGNTKPEIFPELSAVENATINHWLSTAGSTPFRAVWPMLANFIQTKGENLHLTESATPAKSIAVKLQLPSLLERLNRATKESGKMTALADFLGVPLASVSRWLSGKREPGGEITLRLLKWVEQQERQ